MSVLGSLARLQSGTVIDCTLVTCEKVADLDPDDRLLMRELQARGLTVSVETWSDPHAQWGASRLCIVRSTWDYHEHYDEFIAWVERVASVTVLKNDPDVLRWNAHKSYLNELERLGVPIVPTVWVPRGEPCDLEELAEARGWNDVVLKPARGAAAHHVTLVRRGAASFATGQAQFARLAQTQDVLVQPYLRSVVDWGERALIFFRGEYSHAVVKKPFDTVLVVGTRSSLVEPEREELDIAARALAAVPGPLLYARVDLLRDDEYRLCVNEVELIEPGLYLGVHEPARRHFADAVEHELQFATTTTSRRSNQCVISGPQ
jgi:glutathione synthase/RimK-type ligase-like ATP-grasp enzyme